MMSTLHSLNVKDLLKRLKNCDGSDLISFDNLDFFKDDLVTDKIQALDAKKQTSIYDLADCRNNETVFGLNNRKYLGSKDRLLDFLDEIITSQVGTTIESFFDAFAGTGAVGNRFRKYARKIIANDILYSNYLANTVFLSSQRDSISIKKVQSIIDHLRTLKGKNGYISRNYGGTYFTHKNASLMDSIRERIEDLYLDRECTKQERDLLLVSLLYGMDKVANTVGQYDAFLKAMGSPAYVNGRHKIDSNVYSQVVLKRPLVFFDGVNETYNQDVNHLASEIEAEVVYLDPPYNNRQYIDCYHLLENVCLWAKPELYGKTRKFPRGHLRSKYSSKRSAWSAFQDLISKLKCAHIFLSYNSEGIIVDEEIIDVLRRKGKTEIFQRDYSVFGNGAGVSQRRTLKERVFYCRVNRL